MSILSSFFIALISGYLAFTDGLAAYILRVLPADHVAVTEPAATSSLIKLESVYTDVPYIFSLKAWSQTAMTIDATDTNTYTRDPLEALVNIFCTYADGEQTRVITGTGFMVDSDGIILTNAHVAQYLLLEDVLGEAECIIRTGNPATPAYAVSLLYISPAWVLYNADQFRADRPTGTGERDYALLYVTAGLDNKPIPRTFPALKIVEDELPVVMQPTDVLAAGYPAETIYAENDADAALIPRVAPSSIAALMTYGTNTVDVFTISGSAIGEQGSSGGPIIYPSGEVVGMISTRGDDATYGEGSLRALTLPYIARTYQEETKTTFTQGLSGNLPARAAIFKETLTPLLQTLLTDGVPTSSTNE